LLPRKGWKESTQFFKRLSIPKVIFVLIIRCDIPQPRDLLPMDNPFTPLIIPAPERAQKSSLCVLRVLTFSCAVAKHTLASEKAINHHTVCMINDLYLFTLDNVLYT
jgi:hypothetical protein